MIDWLLVTAPLAFSVLVFGLALGTHPVDISLHEITSPSALTDRGYAEGTLDDLLERRIVAIIDEAGSDRVAKRIQIGTPDTAINAYAEIVNVEAPVRATQRLLDLVHYVAEIHFLADAEGQTVDATLRIRDSNTLHVAKFETFRHSVDDIDGLLEQLARSIVGFLDPYILAVYLYQEAGKEQATTQYEDVVAYVRDVSSVSDREFLPWFYGLLGQLAERLNDPELAIEYYDLALRLDPRFYLAHTNWGRVLADQDQFDEALEQYAAALNINPNKPIAHVYLARALMEQRRYEEALAELTRAAALAPEFAAIYQTRAAIFEQLDLPELAQRALQRADTAQRREPRQNRYDTF
jgi:tetratricopeptide (TPR) repeat protein